MSGDIQQVIHPDHYNSTKYETWDVLDEWFPTDPLLWQVGKYLSRAGKKGSMLKDLEKAVNYLNRRIEQEKKKECQTT